MKLLLLPAVALTAGTVYSITYLGAKDPHGENEVRIPASVARTEQRVVELKMEREREAFMVEQRAKLSPPKPQAEPEVVPEPLPTRPKKKCKDSASWERAANNPRLRKNKGPLILGQGPCEDRGKVSFLR
jgi:hypothetical protein